MAIARGNTIAAILDAIETTLDNDLQAELDEVNTLNTWTLAKPVDYWRHTILDRAVNRTPLVSVYAADSEYRANIVDGIDAQVTVNLELALDRSAISAADNDETVLTKAANAYAQAICTVLESEVADRNTNTGRFAAIGVWNYRRTRTHFRPKLEGVTNQTSGYVRWTLIEMVFTQRQPETVAGSWNNGADFLHFSEANLAAAPTSANLSIGDVLTVDAAQAGDPYFQPDRTYEWTSDGTYQRWADVEWEPRPTELPDLVAWHDMTTQPVWYESLPAYDPLAYHYQDGGASVAAEADGDPVLTSYYTDGDRDYIGTDGYDYYLTSTGSPTLRTDPFGTGFWGIEFDGTNDAWISTLRASPSLTTGATTWWVMFRTPATVDDGTIMHGRDGTTGAVEDIAITIVAGALTAECGGSTITGPDLDASTNYAAIMVVDGASSKLIVSGVEYAGTLGAVPAYGGIVLGAEYAAASGTDWCEVTVGGYGIADDALSAAEIADIEAHLAKRTGLVLRVPAGGGAVPPTFRQELGGGVTGADLLAEMTADQSTATAASSGTALRVTCDPGEEWVGHYDIVTGLAGLGDITAASLAGSIDIVAEPSASYSVALALAIHDGTLDLTSGVWAGTPAIMTTTAGNYVYIGGGLVHVAALNVGGFSSIAGSEASDFTGTADTAHAVSVTIAPTHVTGADRDVRAVAYGYERTGNDLSPHSRASNVAIAWGTRVSVVVAVHELGGSAGLTIDVDDITAMVGTR